MDNTYEKVVALIEKQQKDHEEDAVFMVGEQLKDIAKNNQEAAQILLDDLSVEGMGIEEAEKAIHDFANKNHGKAKSFCVSPKKAEEILRQGLSI